MARTEATKQRLRNYPTKRNVKGARQTVAGKSPRKTLPKAQNPSTANQAQQKQAWIYRIDALYDEATEAYEERLSNWHHVEKMREGRSDEELTKLPANDGPMPQPPSREDLEKLNPFKLVRKVQKSVNVRQGKQRKPG
ncbi:MAG: hypothetical protein Q9183_001117, partial [Haloplaca sp. 2 TL-2023]